MKSYLRWAFGLLLAIAPLLASADTLRGMPLLRRYGPEDYNATPQQLGLTVDREGRLYVGNAIHIRPVYTPSAWAVQVQRKYRDYSMRWVAMQLEEPGVIMPLRDWLLLAVMAAAAAFASSA